MATVDLDRVRALTFDVGGTVFDWHHSIRDEVAELARGQGVDLDAAQFANDWRRRMFELLFQMRAGEIEQTNADGLHRLALDDVVPAHGLELGIDGRDELNRVWHRLQVWPDFPEALEALRSRYTVVVLTVLSWSIAVDSSKANGLSWDGILSCEFLGHYKPDRAAYLRGLEVIGVAPEEAMMVAAHPGDLRAAMEAGLSAAYVPRPGERGEGNDGDLSAQDDFAVNATDFPDLARQLVG
jgi:2-haloacid dehalogenase